MNTVKKKKNFFFFHFCPTGAKSCVFQPNLMKTLQFPAEELKAQRQKVMRPQALSSQESSEEGVQCQTPSPKAWRAGEGQGLAM